MSRSKDKKPSKGVNKDNRLTEIADRLRCAKAEKCENIKLEVVNGRMEISVLPPPSKKSLRVISGTSEELLAAMALADLDLAERMREKLLIKRTTMDANNKARNGATEKESTARQNVANTSKSSMSGSADRGLHFAPPISGDTDAIDS
jgi:hypothetical protein